MSAYDWDPEECPELVEWARRAAEYEEMIACKWTSYRASRTASAMEIDCDGAPKLSPLALAKTGRPGEWPSHCGGHFAATRDSSGSGQPSPFAAMAPTQPDARVQHFSAAAAPVQLLQQPPRAPFGALAPSAQKRRPSRDGADALAAPDLHKRLKPCDLAARSAPGVWGPFDADGFRMT